VRFPHISEHPGLGAQMDAALASIARLLGRMHDAAAAVEVPGGRWNRELADPAGGPMVCHDDVCPENVVFRDGEAVGLIDFDFER
jgi:Ser/Thr protein kinase RdoA (MazF antagonist)